MHLCCCCFVFLCGLHRDISFLCDALVNQRKTIPLPPLTDRSATGDIHVSCHTHTGHNYPRDRKVRSRRFYSHLEIKSWNIYIHFSTYWCPHIQCEVIVRAILSFRTWASQRVWFQKNITLWKIRGWRVWSSTRSESVPLWLSTLFMFTSWFSSIIQGPLFFSAFTVQLQDDEQKLRVFPSLWAPK